MAEQTKLIKRPLISLNNIEKTYIHKMTSKSVLRDITFQLQENEMIGIVGNSGCGKSTLLKIIAQLEEHQSGDLVYDNSVFATLGSKEFYKSFQMVFQNPLDAFNPRNTVKAFLEEAMQSFFQWPKVICYERIVAMFNEVNLDPELLNKFPHQLSGGQLQRIVIARALLLEAKVILFDEPTSALDVITQADIIALIKKLQQRFKFSGIVVSHDLAVVQALTKKIHILGEGRIVETVEANQIKTVTHPIAKQLVQARLS